MNMLKGVIVTPGELNGVLFDSNGVGYPDCKALRREASPVTP